MPITQDRMLALIHAGEDLLSNYQRLLNEALENERETKTDYEAGIPVDWRGMYRGLIYKIQEYRPNIDVVTVIGYESGHFKRNRKHNDRTREQMTRLRRRRARAATGEPDDDYYENQEPAALAVPAAAPVEISVPERPIDYDQLHQQLFDLEAPRNDRDGSLNVDWIIKILRDVYRIRSEAKQVEVLNNLMASGAIVQQTIRSQYVVTDPGQPQADVPADPNLGGLLPERMLGLKRHD